jgi:hypothetical protein
MGHKYYDSAATGESAPYESVATAANDLATALGAIGAVDEIIWVNNTSSETLSVNTTYTASATYAPPENPQRLYSVSDFDASPGALAAGAQIATTGSQSITLAGNWDINGVSFLTGTGGGSLSGANFILQTSNGSGKISISNSTLGTYSTSNSAGPVRLGPALVSGTDSYASYIKHTTLFYGAAGQTAKIGSGKYELKDITIAGNATPTTLFASQAAGSVAKLLVADSDLTGKSWTSFADLSTTSAQSEIVVENCKTPGGISWTTGTIEQNSSITVINSGSADVSYGFAWYGYAGSIIHDPSVYAASNPFKTPNSNVPYSVLMVSGSSCGRGQPLTRKFQIPIANDATKTPYVELLVQGDGAAARNSDEIYINARTITTDGTTLGTSVTSHPGAITAGSALAAGTVSYTGDGYTTERTHRIETAPVTARQDCFVEIEVCLAKASDAIYIGQVGLV